MTVSPEGKPVVVAVSARLGGVGCREPNEKCPCRIIYCEHVLPIGETVKEKEVKPCWRKT